MSRFIFQCLSLAILVIMAVTWFTEYFDLHPYYSGLAGNTQNRWLVLWWLIWSLIPVWVLFFSKKLTVKKFLIGLLMWTVFYWICLVMIRWWLFGLWIILLAWNTFVLLWLGVLQTLIFLALGDTIKQKFLFDEERNWSRVGIALTLWISIEIIVIYLLMLLNILFPIVSRVLLFWWLWYTWQYRTTLLWAWKLVVQWVKDIKLNLASVSFSKNLIWWIVIVLIILSLWYMLNGFQLSFMPYSTAWDANHAYMFYPKMRSFNNGVYWFEQSMQTTPHLWYAYLTFWFSLFGRSDWIWAVSSDTIVLSLNFWSGIYVLILWVVLVKTLFANMKHKAVGFLTGWALVLVWLTSGMGAFLVFVDNKTDMWVLALIIWAILTWFAVLNSLKWNGISRRERMWLIISWILYAVAVLAKPTAMFDVVNFAMYLRWMLFWSLWVVMIWVISAWLLTFIEFRGIKEYLPQSWGSVLVGWWAVLWLWNLIQNSQKKIFFWIRVLLIRWVAFIATMLIVKTPYLIWKTVTQDWNPSIGDVVKTIFLSKQPDSSKLLVQSSNQELWSVCTLGGQWFSTTEDLYTSLKPVQWSAYNEDVVRYKGFGWKGNSGDRRRNVLPFIKKWRTPFVPSWCTVVTLQHRDELKLLCENIEAIRSFSTSTIITLAQQVNVSAWFSDILKELASEISSSTDAQDTLKSRLNPKIQELIIAVESSTIYNNIETGEIYMPYKWIVPFNVSYNRSLQNVSSYYTDIGIMRLVCFIFSFLGIIYWALFSKKQVLVSSMVTCTAWILWWFIASWIVRYSIGLIVWSLISFVVFISSLFDGHSDENEIPLQKIVRCWFLIVLWWMILLHLGLNMVRIASQWWNNAFMRYKASVGKMPVYDEWLNPINKIITGFGKDEVFSMQFPHYKPFLNAMNARDDDEWGFIAGTYIRYFVTDQSGVKYDQFLTWLWQKFSDNDVCNSYLRLQNEAIRYMAIDLNIGTVVQWEWNRSLFDRFFARVNTVTNTIEEEWTISMLIGLSQQWYVKYLSSNNIGAKYAFTISDNSFPWLTGEKLRLFKSRMSVARYFSNDQQLFQSITQIAEQRILDWNFVTDIADMIGMWIREDELVVLARKQQITSADIVNLSQNERRVFAQYLSFRNMQQTDHAQFSTMLQNTIRSSIGNPNQILALEVVE